MNCRRTFRNGRTPWLCSLVLCLPALGMAQQGAEIGLISWEFGPKGIQQGLKPIDFVGLIGTTEVVPCYKAPLRGVFFAASQASSPASAGSSGSIAEQRPSVMLDKVVAVVNNQAILASDVEEEIRLAVLDPGQAGLGVLTPVRALEQLIGRNLIEQQMHEEDALAVAPTQAEVVARLVELRKELPACVHENCASETEWKAFLAQHDLSPERVESYLRYRIQILRFIEHRFRQGIRISQQDIQTYYDQMLLPEYAAGEAIPSMETVAPRIEEILLQRQVNALFDVWLTNLRQQGDIEVLDPALKTAATQVAPEKVDEGKGSK